MVPEGDKAELGDLQEHVDARELVQPVKARGRVLGEEVLAGEGFGEGGGEGVEVVREEDIGFKGLEEVEGKFGGWLVGFLVGGSRGVGGRFCRWDGDGVGGIGEFEEVYGSGRVVEDV